MSEAHEKSSVAARLREEIVQYVFITTYLAAFFMVFAWHRRLILDEAHIAPDPWWQPLLEAAVLGKVIMILDLLGAGKRLEHLPLAIPVLHKTVIFGLGITAFAILEATVRGLFRGEGMGWGMHTLLAIGPDEMISRILAKVCALVPFFAFREVSRVLGAGRLFSLFFKESRPPELSHHGHHGGDRH